MDRENTPYASELAARISREREAYNETLQRATYDSVLSHASAISHRRMVADAQAIMRSKAGGRFLELGSYTWIAWIDRSDIVPGELHCINISEAELDIGRRHLAHSRVKPFLHLMDAHTLEFEDGTFDLVFGTGILHHLDLKVAISEVKRVLKPGGQAIFFEPLGTNPVGNLVRVLTPRARTVDERPLSMSDLRLLKSNFQCDMRYLQLLSVPAGLLSRVLFRSGDNALMRAADVCDRALEPLLGPIYRYVLICATKMS